MKISKAISDLQKAMRQLGDVDLVYVADNQFCDVTSVEVMTAPTEDLQWCWSGPVALVRPAAGDARNSTQTSPKPARVVVNMTGGLFEGSWSDAPAEIMVIDTDDPDNPRLDVPTIGTIWAGSANAIAAPDCVSLFFDQATWIPEKDEEAPAAAGETEPDNPSA